jgi:hypothetical protein
MKKSSCSLLGLAFVLALSASAATPTEPQGPPQSPQFTAAGQLLKPANYREWVNVGTGLNMAYGPARNLTPNGHPPFTNVFVNPGSYRSFLQTGTWPDQTLFILEIRASLAVNKVPNGANGYYQGDLLGLEAHVKDEKRFAGRWAFFGFGKSGAAGVLIPTAAACYSCHAQNAAVDTTFVQFYPELRDIAKDKGTLGEVPETF